MLRQAAWLLVPTLTACSAAPLPTRPSPSIAAPSVMWFEGLTLHLAPGESVLWTFDVQGAEVRYAVSIAYSNGKEGENKVLSVAVDGRTLLSFAQAGEQWG